MPRADGEVLTVVACLLAVAFLLSALNQIPGPWARYLGPVGSFGVLPGLAFFAPDPIDIDYHLVFRDYLEDGSPGPWSEIPMAKHGPMRVLWSTAKREHQAMLAAVAGLSSLQLSVAALAADPEGLLQISLPYLFLLHTALQPGHAPRATERQFMIVETTGFGSERRLSMGILSNPHRLG